MRPHGEGRALSRVARPRRRSDILVAELFEGIAGFGLGLERARGFRVVYANEVAAFPAACHAKNRPGVPLDRRSVAEVCGRALRGVDLLVGGWPCQDLSTAGKRAGLSGARSGLFFQVARLLREAAPRAFLLENVPGLLHSDGGRDFGRVLSTLVGLGYRVAWRRLDGRHAGLPCYRKRVLLAGFSERAGGDPARVLLWPRELRADDPQRAPMRPDAPAGTAPRAGARRPEVFILETGRALSSRRRHRLHVRTEPPVYTLNSTHWHGFTMRAPDGDWTPPRDFAPEEYERMMGFPAGWTDLGPGTSRWDRLRALGNAVQPPLIEEVGRYLKEEFWRR